jgi:hypothetical protein
MSQYDHDDPGSNREPLGDEITTEQTSTTNLQDGSTALDTMKDYHLKMIEIAQVNADSAFEFARELLSAKTPSDVMELCTTRAQEQLQQLTQQTQEMTDFEQQATLEDVYIEARPKGCAETDAITDFVVEDHSGEVLGTFDTQMEAILWAKDAGHEALVACNRNLSDKGNPKHWRAF